MDGFRRLERTRAAARGTEHHDVPTPSEPIAATGIRRSRRVAGALRVIGMLGVVAIIAGTSIGLATSDPRPRSNERTAASSPLVDVGPVQGPPAPVVVHAKRPPTPEAAATKTPTTAVKTAVARAAEPVAVQAATSVPISAASVATPSASLPLTGADVDVLRILLAGSLLALLGMLVQIAGTPLPAHTRR